MGLFGLHLIDIVVIVAYLALLVWIGAYFSRKQNTFEDFAKGGKQIGWLPIGVSLMAALNSGIDFVQTPAVVYAVGLVFITLIVGWIPLYPWISRVTIPFYQRLDVYSAYEYLERRFSLSVRTIASLIFVSWRVGWMGAALYVPILAFQGATGNEDKQVSTLIAIVLGVVVTTYTMLGGIKAVVWTDVLQFCIMFVGLFTMLAVVISANAGRDSRDLPNCPRCAATQPDCGYSGNGECRRLGKGPLVFHHRSDGCRYYPGRSYHALHFLYVRPSCYPAFSNFKVAQRCAEKPQSSTQSAIRFGSLFLVWLGWRSMRSTRFRRCRREAPIRWLSHIFSRSTFQSV